MINEEKYRQLIALLVKRTDAGAAWEPTERDGVFALSLPDYTVQISQRRRQDAQDDINIQIVGWTGTTIDSFTHRDVARGLPPEEYQIVYSSMFELFEKARRKALGVDVALDKLIQELGKE